MWYVEYCVNGAWYREPDAVSHAYAMRSLTANAINAKGERLKVRAVFACSGE